MLPRDTRQQYPEQRDAGARPRSAARPHHVVYTWGVSRKLKGNQWRTIGLGWTNPGTGARESATEANPGNTKPLQFPYVAQFDVIDLHADNQHVSTVSTADVPNLTVDCTITVDGQVISADLGSEAVVDPDGTVQTGGGSQCMPHK